jgi:predicted lipid-binding transport protein (Tim44 family)
MNKLAGITLTLIIGLTLFTSGISDAEARRFGGARSFGGKSAFSSPYRRSAIPKRSTSQQQAYNHNQTARQNMSRRGGFMGMLGGLALGGLLGAMFFGGAFEGINFMDILIFGGIAYLLYKLFAAKARPPLRTSYDRSAYTNQGDLNDNQPRQTGFATDYLFNKDKKPTVPQHIAAVDAGFEPFPEGFDEHTFLEGSKSAFLQLQTAWDNKDLGEIRGLTTDKVFAEIKAQIKSSDEINHTQILKLEAELLDVRETGSAWEAVVLFDAIMREDVDDTAKQVREVWHFTKSVNSLKPTWFLDGIQQLEE